MLARVYPLNRNHGRRPHHLLSCVTHSQYLCRLVLRIIHKKRNPPPLVLLAFFHLTVLWLTMNELNLHIHGKSMRNRNVVELHLPGSTWRSPTNVLTLANWKRTRYQVIWLPSGIYGITFKARDCQLECKNWNPLPVCACPKSLLQTYVDPSPFTDDMCAFCTGYNESANKSLHTCDAWQDRSTLLALLAFQGDLSSCNWLAQHCTRWWWVRLSIYIAISSAYLHTNNNTNLGRSGEDPLSTHN